MHLVQPDTRLATHRTAAEALADRFANPFPCRRTLPLSHMIEASQIATKHGQTAKVGLLRYIFGSVVALAVLFGLFIVAGMEL